MRESIVVDRVAIAELVSEKMNSSIMPLVSSYKYVVVSEPDSHTRIIRNIPILKEKYISPSWEDWDMMLTAVKQSGLIERLQSTNTWAQYSSQHQIGFNSAERTCMLFMLGRWYNADIVCSYARWKVLAEFLQSEDVSFAKRKGTSGKVTLPAFTTEATTFPMNFVNDIAGAEWERFVKPIEYQFISMPDPEEQANLLGRSWRESLAHLIGPRLTTGVIAGAGLAAFALGIYKYSDLVLSWLAWLTRLVR